MDSEKIKETWSAYDNSLDKLWALNMKSIELVQTQKANGRLQALVSFKKRAAAAGLIYVILLALLIYGNHLKNLYFTVSVGMILFLTLYAIVVYIKHILLIKEINYSDNILATQEKLSVLQTSTLDSVRILWLQLPFWCTWFWNTQWITERGLSFWYTAFPITLIFVFAAIWLYLNLRLENRHKRYFKIFVGGIEWTAISQAMTFLDEIEEFKKN
jgi:hypothetical protein